MELPPAAEELLALPPSRFGAEREALARSLASRGDPAAPAVRKLRRPVGLAWVLNRLARERAAEVEALVEAGDRLRDGQRRALAGGGAEGLRRAEQDLRERVRALGAEARRILASEGRRDDPVALARLELLLRAAAPVPGPSREALRRGVLEREPEVTGELSGLSVLPGGESGAPAGAGGGRPGPQPGHAAREAAERDRRRGEERATRLARERELARLRREAAAAQERAARAERRAAEAEARASRERERAAEEREEAERARRRVEEAERRG